MTCGWRKSSSGLGKVQGYTTVKHLFVQKQFEKNLVEKMFSVSACINRPYNRRPY